MKSRYLRTTDVARGAGVHPNTVRLYETLGFLPPIPRTPSGYRLYTEMHLEQMRLARLVLHGVWAGRPIRRSGIALIKLGATGDLEATLALAHEHLAIVHAEQAQAEAAATFLEQWAQGLVPAAPTNCLNIGQVARLLAISTDMVRDWERNGLIEVPRNPENRYRCYGPLEIGRLRVIRLLRQSGYSTMAILRMVLQLDQGQREGLREVLDTPRPDEDILCAADRWLSTLAEQEERAGAIIAQVEKMVALSRRMLSEKHTNAE